MSFDKNDYVLYPMQCHLHGYARSAVAMIQLSSILPEGIVEVS